MFLPGFTLPILGVPISPLVLLGIAVRVLVGAVWLLDPVVGKAQAAALEVGALEDVLEVGVLEAVVEEAEAEAEVEDVEVEGEEEDVEVEEVLR